MTSDDDALRVWFRLIRLHTRSRLAVANRLRALDLSVPQCDVLTTLTECEGLSQQELAERLYVTKGNISGLVDRLVLHGLVERRALAGDRRSYAIYLTPQGRELAKFGVEAQKAFVSRTFARISPERMALFEEVLVDLRDLVRAESDNSAVEGLEV